MMSTAGHIRTRKEKPALAHDGFMYRFDRHSIDDGKCWRCLRDQCIGRIKTDKNDVFVEFRNAVDNHQRNEEALKVKQMVTSMKEKVRTESASLVDIYQSETAAAAMQPNLAANVPTFQEVRTTLARHRRKQLPVLPQTRNDIDLPPALRSNDSFLMVFLYYDS